MRQKRLAHPSANDTGFTPASWILCIDDELVCHPLECIFCRIQLDSELYLLEGWPGFHPFADVLFQRLYGPQPPLPRSPLHLLSFCSCYSLSISCILTQKQTTSASRQSSRIQTTTFPSRLSTRPCPRDPFPSLTCATQQPLVTTSRTSPHLILPLPSCTITTATDTTTDAGAS